MALTALTAQVGNGPLCHRPAGLCAAVRKERQFKAEKAQQRRLGEYDS